MWLVIAAIIVGVIMYSDKKYSTATTILSAAIAHAEGYGASPTNYPTRNNNPGDIEVGGVKAVFTTVGQGWTALFDKIENILAGNSTVYPLSMTFGQLASTYTGLPAGTTDWNDWVETVLNDVRVPTGVNLTVDSTLADFYGQA